MEAADRLRLGDGEGEPGGKGCRDEALVDRDDGEGGEEQLVEESDKS